MPSKRTRLFFPPQDLLWEKNFIFYVHGVYIMTLQRLSHACLKCSYILISSTKLGKQGSHGGFKQSLNSSLLEGYCVNEWLDSFPLEMEWNLSLQPELEVQGLTSMNSQLHIPGHLLIDSDFWAHFLRSARNTQALNFSWNAQSRQGFF